VTVWYAGRNKTEVTFRPAHQSPIYSDKYKVSHKYSIFSWWWAHSCPKHVEKNSKHIKKICAPRWFYLQKIIEEVFELPVRSYVYREMESNTRLQ